MKWTQSKSLKLTRVLIAFFIACVIVCALVLPWLLKTLFPHVMEPRSRYVRALIGLWLCALCALPALWMMYRLVRNIERDQVFIGENVRLLRYVSWCCFALTAIYTAMGFGWYFGILFIPLMAFIGLIVRVVKNVLAQAVELKKENDLTI